MRLLAYILFFFFALNIRAQQNELLLKAEIAYDSKKYAQAVKAYEQLIEEGFKSYELYFNLGNSYYKNNQLGKAIYYYELARKLSPSDEDVKINLGIAASKTIDKIDAKENFFISAVKANVLSSFSTSVWAWLSVFSMILAAILFYIFIHASKLVVKRVSFLFSCIFIVAFFLTYLLGFSALSAKNVNKFAIVTSKEIKVMNEPTSMSKSKFILHEGTKIKVVKNNGDWVLIKLDNGNEGWVKLLDVGII